MMMAIIVLCLPLILVYYATAAPIIFDITAYGATPEADINQALSEAWMAAISSTEESKVVIPEGKWKLSQAVLQGPNLGPIELENKGTIQANSNPNDMPQGRIIHWININFVNRFTLSGGVYDGRGQQAWALNDCNAGLNCKRLPNNFSFSYMTNSINQDVTTMDSKFFHVNCLYSKNVSFIRMNVSVPGNSPNTDGIHVAHSRNVNITDSVIGTGDDCISMGDQLLQVHIRNVTCGPGHGISIGSLGRNADEGNVSGVHVKDCVFTDTSNGVRIKTWPSGPAMSLVSDLHFEDLVMTNVYYPIINDQNYCPWKQCNRTSPSLVQIRDLTIKNVKGSTSNEHGIKLVCSEAKPCENVEMADIDISYVGKTDKDPKNFEIISTCVNINPTFKGTINPPICKQL